MGVSRSGESRAASSIGLDVFYQQRPFPLVARKREYPVKFTVSWATSEERLLVTDTLDSEVLRLLQEGSRVVYATNNREDKTLPRHDWACFWREMAIWLPEDHPVLGDFPHEEVVDLQFLGLTMHQAFNLTSFRESVTPLVWGTNPRTPGAMMTDYVFETRVADGRLLACCLNVFGKGNVAGHYLLRSVAKYAASDAFDPVTELAYQFER